MSFAGRPWTSVSKATNGNCTACTLDANTHAGVSTRLRAAGDNTLTAHPFPAPCMCGGADFGPCSGAFPGCPVVHACRRSPVAVAMLAAAARAPRAALSDCPCTRDTGSPRCLFRRLPVPVPSGRRADVRGVCCWWDWLVVRFVCVPLCVRVSRVSRACPGSPRCLFTGTVLYEYV